MGDYVRIYQAQTEVLEGMVVNPNIPGAHRDMVKVQVDGVGSFYFHKKQCELRKSPRFFWIRESSMMTEVMSDEPADLADWIKVIEVV